MNDLFIQLRNNIKGVLLKYRLECDKPSEHIYCIKSGPKVVFMGCVARELKCYDEENGFEIILEFPDESNQYQEVKDSVNAIMAGALKEHLHRMSTVNKTE